jgi:hypothetical protein
MANRFFAFGCSFTKHAWPTWAHCSAELHRRMGVVDHTYNFGCGGASNKLIAHTVMLAKAVHNIDSEDIVYIMWTTPDRTDTWACSSNIHTGIHEGWHPQGSIFHSEYAPKTIDQTFTIQSFHADMLQYKRLIREVLPHAVYCDWHGGHEVGILGEFTDPGNPSTKPAWGYDQLHKYYSSSVNTDNPAYFGVGNEKLTSDRNPQHERFLLTDTLIDPHPHPQAHFDCAVKMYNKHLTGTDAQHYTQVVKSVGDDVAQYTRDLNKLHTDAYNRVHAAYDDVADLYPSDRTIHDDDFSRSKAHHEWISNPVHTTKLYTDMDNCNKASALNYEMCPERKLNHHGMHRNTYGDLWYASSHASQSIEANKIESVYGISYDALHEELYEEWCDALFPAHSED